MTREEIINEFQLKCYTIVPIGYYGNNECKLVDINGKEITRGTYWHCFETRETIKNKEFAESKNNSEIGQTNDSVQERGATVIRFKDKLFDSKVN